MIHNFQDDNAIGKRGERIFAAFLESRGCRYEDVSESKEYQDKDVDFIVYSRKEPGRKVMVEVKNDTRIAQTGNVFFETMSNVDFATNGCFSKTEADLMAIVSETEKLIYFVDAKFLKEYVGRNNDSLRFISRVPGSNSCGYLIPLTRLGNSVKKVRYA